MVMSVLRQTRRVRREKPGTCNRSNEGSRRRDSRPSTSRLECRHLHGTPCALPLVKRPGDRFRTDRRRAPRQSARRGLSVKARDRDSRAPRGTRRCPDARDRTREHAGARRRRRRVCARVLRCAGSSPRRAPRRFADPRGALQGTEKDDPIRHLLHRRRCGEPRG
jgi:hypothetical protein